MDVKALITFYYDFRLGIVSQTILMLANSLVDVSKLGVSVR